MRALVLFIGLLLTQAFPAASQPAVCTAADSLEIVSWLAEAQQTAPKTAVTLHFARKMLGRPYVAHTLEAEGEERLIVNTRQLDCTTLVETVTALTLCTLHKQQSFADYVHWLTRLRYRNGTIDGYASRLHYFSDWIVCNQQAKLVTELQQPDPPFTALQHLHVNYMSTHPQSYSALRSQPQLVPIIARQEQQLTGLQFRYIPKALVSRSSLLRNVIQDGDIIAITTSKPGLEIAHLGFAVWQADGLHLLNASQLHKKVVVEPMTLSQYLKRHPSHTGIRIIRINSNI